MIKYQEFKKSCFWLFILKGFLLLNIKMKLQISSWELPVLIRGFEAILNFFFTKFHYKEPKLRAFCRPYKLRIFHYKRTYFSKFPGFTINETLKPYWKEEHTPILGDTPGIELVLIWGMCVCMCARIYLCVSLFCYRIISLLNCSL